MNQRLLIYCFVIVLLFLALPLRAGASSPADQPVVQSGKHAPIKVIIKTYSFAQVWNLIWEYQQSRPTHFSPELISCLMWEESGFRLVENPYSHALGFGQVMPSTLNWVNKKYGTQFTRARVLSDPAASVQVTILALEAAYDWKKDKTRALLVYAGGMRNYKTVRKWISAEPTMVQAGWMDAAASEQSREISAERMIRGMGMCSQPGYDPRQVF